VRTESRSILFADFCGVLLDVECAGRNARPQAIDIEEEIDGIVGGLCGGRRRCEPEHGETAASTKHTIRREGTAPQFGFAERIGCI
jgi:hypothetical protein